uniref:Fibrinogen C-terminal domain-containing protein n=1 Tax=Anopheles atroparvus TaxID=41427 RepID=A0AAG5DAU0_ANOAO
MKLVGLVVCCLSVAILATPSMGRELPIGAIMDAKHIHHGAHYTSGPQRLHPKSCRDTLKRESGVYWIQPEWPFYEPMLVYCDQDYEYGGWTVIQRRIDGTVNFDRDLRDYIKGFGNIDEEFWLGLENIYQLAKSEPHELLIWLKDFSGNTSYARYAHLNMNKFGTHYDFRECGSYSGSAGDNFCKYGPSFLYRDNVGGFWDSSQSNLNGKYVPYNDRGDRGQTVKGLYWGDIKAGSIKEAKMMLRPKAREN